MGSSLASFNTTIIHSKKLQIYLLLSLLFSFNFFFINNISSSASSSLHCCCQVVLQNKHRLVSRNISWKCVVLVSHTLFFYCTDICCRVILMKTANVLSHQMHLTNLLHVTVLMLLCLLLLKKRSSTQQEILRRISHLALSLLCALYSLL